MSSKRSTRGSFLDYQRPTVNERLAQWFDAGSAKEALLGGEPFIIPEATHRDRHDRLLVVDQLLLWAAARGRLQDAAAAFLAALDTAIADLDLWAAYDLVWSYLVARRDHESDLPVSKTEILHVLDEIDGWSGETPDGIVELRTRVRDELAATP